MSFLWVIGNAFEYSWCHLSGLLALIMIGDLTSFEVISGFEGIV